TTGAAKINIDATGDNDWIISPELTIPATPAYRFTYSVGATQFGGTVAPTTAWEADDFVQVLVSTSGYTNWTELKLYGSTNVPSHLGQTDILDLSAYAGQTIRIAFRGVEGAANGSADIDFFTDNWVIEETPLCSAPTTLTASGITSSQANLGWTETGTSTTWDIEIGLTGFVPSGTPTYNDVTSNPYTVNGLSAVTGYSYYVRSDCGGSQSVWTGPFNFNTGQEPAVLTFTEGFEIWPNGWSVVNGTQANAWYVGTATANSGNQSAYISNDNGLTNAYTITTTSVVHMYRDIAIPATTFPITVKFNWRGQGEGVAYDRLRVYMVETSVTPVAGTELTSGQIGLTNYNLQPDWTLSSLELPAATYSGATWRLVFTWKNDISDGTQPPIAIDDIEVSLVTCPDPTALTASSLQTNQATLSWTENGTATSWDIELGADGFTPTGTPTQTGVTNPYIYTGLTEATAYDYYVRSDCGAGDYSAWVGPFGFNTLASCAEPTTLTAANITSSSADLGWTAVGGTTTWNVEVGAVGFIPGTGAEVVAITGTTNNPTSVNGLSAQTTYLFYVQSDCGGGQLSNWAGPFSFTTPCAAISAFPWTENFESITTPALPSCWSQNNANGDTDFWKTYTTYGVGGSKTAGLYTDGNAGNNNDYLILPAFQLTGNQWLKFYVRARTSSEPNDYRVVLSTTGTLPADFTVELKPLTTVSSTTMTEIEPINLSAYTGTVYIAIHVPSGGLDGYYIYFDNFTIEDMPSCLPMTGVTVNGFTETTAQISWTASASNPADGYDIYYSTSSTAPDAGTTPNLNVGAGETSVEITGLTASSTYYVWVRSDCGGGDYSTWSNAVSFYTGYCIPAPTSQDGFGITNVTFGQTVVVNNTTGSETGFY
ncbi:MAG TPA: choice-of-anchor J domain-containing protein, partial [Bacteroidales bacterium]|nr:choice-of-anchor J domain-containing protein [Bacteroidales bacterium]